MMRSYEYNPRSLTLSFRVMAFIEVMTLSFFSWVWGWVWGWVGMEYYFVKFTEAQRSDNLFLVVTCFMFYGEKYCILRFKAPPCCWAALITFIPAPCDLSSHPTPVKFLLLGYYKARLKSLPTASITKLIRKIGTYV